MSFTHFPHGVSSFGCPVPSGGFPLNGKKHWWVQGNLGNDGNPGDSPDVAFKTMARAFQLIGSGDVIHFTGNITEQISTPAGVFDVTIVGECTRPRHADAHTSNNGYYSATWKPPASPTATTPLLKVLQQGWRFVNILFSTPTDAAGVQLFRDAGAGDLERDASHAAFYDCRFDGGQDGIEDSGGCAFVGIYNCLFRGLTAKALKSTTGAGVGTLLCWEIVGNRFENNVNHIVMGFNQATIKSNAFGKFTTMSIDLNNGADNLIFANSLYGTYSIGGGYRKGSAADVWAGNFNVLSGGITAAVPA